MLAARIAGISPRQGDVIVASNLSKGSNQPRQLSCELVFRTIPVSRVTPVAVVVATSSADKHGFSAHALAFTLKGWAENFRTGSFEDTFLTLRLNSAKSSRSFIEANVFQTETTSSGNSWLMVWENPVNHVFGGRVHIRQGFIEITMVQVET